MQPTDAIKERKHRLPLELYKGIIRVTFTICVENGYSLFSTSTLGAPSGYHEVGAGFSLREVATAQRSLKAAATGRETDSASIAVNAFIEKLKLSNQKYQILNWCYVFMPEHIHIINEGKDKDSDLWKAICLFKQHCGYWLSQNNPSVTLQKDFYDHIHRKDEDLIKQIRYLVENPVRRGLVANWQDYKFVGSLDKDLQELLG